MPQLFTGSCISPCDAPASSPKRKAKMGSSETIKTASCLYGFKENAVRDFGFLHKVHTALNIVLLLNDIFLHEYQTFPHLLVSQYSVQCRSS